MPRINRISKNRAVINLIYFFHRCLYHMIYFAVYVFGTQWKVETKEFGCCMLSNIEIFRYVFFKIIWSVLNIRIISYFDRIANRAIGRNTKTSSSFIILSSIYSYESYRSVTIRSFSSLYGVTIRSLSISNRSTAIRRSSFRAKVRTSESERSRRSTCARLPRVQTKLIIHIRYTFSREFEDVTRESTASPGIERSYTTKTRTIATSRRPYQT